MSHLETNAPEWAIIYSGLDVFTSDDGTWVDAPSDGVLAIVYRSIETGWSIAQPGDYYVCLKDNEFLPIGYDAVEDYMINVFKVAQVNHIGAPTIFMLKNSGRLVDKSGLILFALEKGLIKRGRMVTRTEWGQATGLALEIMANVKKTASFKWEGKRYGYSKHSTKSILASTR